MFADTVRLVPFRSRNYTSRILNTLTALKSNYPEPVYDVAGVHTVPPSITCPAVINGVTVSIISYPLLSYDKKGSLIKIDDRSYYSGRYSSAIELACQKFHIHLLGEVGMPELLESIDVVFNRLLMFLQQCAIDAFEELSFVSYEDRFFRFAHTFGIMLVVSLAIILYLLQNILLIHLVDMA